MFAKYQYKDLTDVKVDYQGNKLEKSQLTILNEKWENLKIESASMVEIYIICAVIAAGIIAFIVYVQVKKRRQRRFYWANVPTPTAKKKETLSPDLSETTQIALEKSKKRDK